MRNEIDAILASVFRAEAGKLVGILTRLLEDFSLAEEVVQEALLLAIERWPEEGIPTKPGAWLLTVARHRALDRLRRDARYREKLLLLEQLPPQMPDDRIQLMFLCCHPALAREAQVPLTLRVVGGFTTAQIAHALVLSEAAVAQRISRARRKITSAGIPYALPSAEELDERLSQVLAVLYLLFTEGYLASGAGPPQRRELAEEAAWLTDLVYGWYPTEPEVMGLLALMRLHLARSTARFNLTGEFVLLPQQNRTLWDRAMMANAVALLERAAVYQQVGPYQLQAAIVACHAEAPTWEATDWLQILVLYDLLLQLAPSPVVRLNRAVALRQVLGVENALREVEALTRDLSNYHLFHAIRGAFLQELGNSDVSRLALQRAYALTHNSAERAVLRSYLETVRETMP
jgi:RNA polymerase sigma factor (sigma-70 family)